MKLNNWCATEVQSKKYANTKIGIRKHTTTHSVCSATKTQRETTRV